MKLESLVSRQAKEVSLKARTVLLLVLLTLCVVPGAVFARDTLVVALNEVVRGGDPQNHTATYTAAVHQLVFDTLIGRDRTGAFIPRLAVSWELADNGRDWIFYLRQGVKFHDGTPFNAEAVKFTFDRLLDPANALAVRSRYTAVKTVEVIDEYTVRFNFDAPFGPFLELMREYGACIVSPAAMKKLGQEGFTMSPVGTGPYIWKSYTPGEKVVLVRNEEYWGEIPRINTVEIVTIPEPAAMLAALEAGDVDFAIPLPPQAALTLETKEGFKVLAEPSTRIYWLTLNTRIPILEKQKVRQALNYAIDYEAIVKGIFFGYARPNNSIIAPGCFGYSPYTVGYHYDPELARKLLTEAGHGAGFEMSLWVREMDSRLGQAIAGFWAQIGVTCEVVVQEEGVHYQLLSEPLEKTQVQATIDTWSSLDAFTGIGPLLHSREIPPNGINWAFYHNPMVDSLLDKAAATADQTERLELYRQAQQIIMSDAPWVVIANTLTIAGMRADLKGVWLEPGGIFRLESAYFE